MRVCMRERERERERENGQRSKDRGGHKYSFGSQKDEKIEGPGPIDFRVNEVPQEGRRGLCKK